MAVNSDAVLSTNDLQLMYKLFDEANAMPADTVLYGDAVTGFTDHHDPRRTNEIEKLIELGFAVDRPSDPGDRFGTFSDGNRDHDRIWPARAGCQPSAHMSPAHTRSQTESSYRRTRADS